MWDYSIPLAATSHAVPAGVAEDEEQELVIVD